MWFFYERKTNKNNWPFQFIDLNSPNSAIKRLKTFCLSQSMTKYFGYFLQINVIYNFND